jgi:hypothetical protein
LITSDVSEEFIKPGNDHVILVLVKSDIQFALIPHPSFTEINTYALFDSRDIYKYSHIADCDQFVVVTVFQDGSLGSDLKYKGDNTVKICDIDQDHDG